MRRLKESGKVNQPQNLVRVRMLETFGEEGAAARRVRWQPPDPDAVVETEGELIEVDDLEITVWPSELPTSVGNGDDELDDGELTVVSYFADTKRWEIVSMGGVLFGKPDEDIDGRTDNTPGSGRVNLWRFKNDGTDDTEDTGRWVTGFNFSSTAATADSFVFLTPNLQGARWLISFEDCGG